ncbi:DUF4040 family protein [Corynebacterium freiburgense]|uniref:DUF4040 family protein n=1 Tax=Corynebacterium freiburgense TaxID=556548 RepID=UPI0003F76947|nr:DUF4040 family protein [Corynebacterium freiburgense]WJZ01458.1 Na(+)/H(+) antiporter subunit A [Corynebacterium freiburgense]
MTLIIVLILAAVACALSPVAVKIMDRRSGWPLGVLYFVTAGILANEVVKHGANIQVRYPWAPNFLSPSDSVDFALLGDGLGVFFALLALCIGAIVFIYSASYLHNNDKNGSFYVIMTAFMFSVLLLMLSDDVVLLFIAWELVSIASFLLIARSGSGGQAGAMRTLILTFTGGLTLLVAITIMATQAGTTNLHEILGASFWAEKPALTTALAILIAVSAFTKAAQLPFHFWLPEAMAAATPVSAFLHAAAVVKAGIYLLLRFSAVFHDNYVWNLLLIITGMSTAIMAAFFAIQKTDLKKLTAYSTVSQLGWIVATIGIGTPFALAAALIHTLAHALFKSSLFMLIGVIDHQAGSRDVRRLGKLYSRMPWTFGCVAIGALSMAAIPPTLGFISKESMLEAFLHAPFGSTGVILLMIAAGIGALFTLSYSARLVLGAFVDGPRDMSHVKEAPVLLWLPAGLPGVLSLPLAFAVGFLDAPVDAIVDTHVHFGLWHGVTVPLIVSLVVMAVGAAAVFARHSLLPLIDGRELLPFSGNSLLERVTDAAKRWGEFAGRMADSYSPSRHLTYPLIVILLLAYTTLLFPGIDGVSPAPRVPNTDRPIDILPLLIIAGSVFGLIRVRSRLNGVILLGTAGVGVTLQILVLGAPDVALTQFLVEILVVIIMMMVIRQQPTNFHTVAPRRALSAGIFAILTGIATFAAVWELLGRHERPEIAMWYLTQAPEISGGANIVNTILVEFRALDTLGELAVLGMAGVVIAAVVGSIPRHPFHKGTHPAPFGASQLNAIPMKVLVRQLIPILGILSFLIFMRGHNDPGGGFIAALVAGGAFMLFYLSRGRDEQVVRTNTPYYLTGLGVLTAITAGFLGYFHHSFLAPIHGYIFGEHFTTSMIFDVGVFLAVLGMLTVAVNDLGGYLRPGTDKELLPFKRGGDHPLEAHPAVEISEDSDPDWPEARSATWDLSTASGKEQQ